MKKAYVFVNSYICGKQTGIQAAHALVNLSIKHNATDYKKWAKYYETLVILNGGDCDGMRRIRELMCELDLCVGIFREPGLGNPAPFTALAYVPDADMMNRIESLVPNQELIEEQLLDYRWTFADIIVNSRTHNG